MKLLTGLFCLLILNTSIVLAQQKELSSGEIVLHSISKTKIEAKSTVFKSKLDLSENTIDLVIPLQSFKYNLDASKNSFESKGNMNVSQFSEVIIKAKLSANSDLKSAERNIVSIDGEATIKGKTHKFKTNGLLVNKGGVSILTATFSLNGKLIGLEDKNLNRIEVSVKANY